MMLPAGLKPEQPAGCGRGGVMGEGAVGCLLLRAAVRCPWVHPHLFQRMHWKQMPPSPSSVGCLNGCAA